MTLPLDQRIAALKKAFDALGFDTSELPNHARMMGSLGFQVRTERGGGLCVETSRFLSTDRVSFSMRSDPPSPQAPPEHWVELSVMVPE